jgi:hypothetical protein
MQDNPINTYLSLETSPPCMHAIRPSNRAILRNSRSRRHGSARQRQQRKQASDNGPVAEGDAGITSTNRSSAKGPSSKSMLIKTNQNSRSAPTTKSELGVKYLLSGNGVVQIRESKVGGCAAEPGRDGGDEAVAEGRFGGCCYEEFPVVCGGWVVSWGLSWMMVGGRRESCWAYSWCRNVWCPRAVNNG